MRAQAWSFAQDYDADTVAEQYWAPALKRLEAAVDERRDAASKPPTAASLHTSIREADGFLWLDRGHRTDDWIGWSNHENTLAPVLEELLPEGGVFLDVGAHIGRWSVRMAARASHVFAVEPNPDTLSVLRKHLAINDITNATIIDCAAWDETCWLELHDDNQRLSGGSTRVLDPGTMTTGENLVQAVRLDEVAELVGADRIDLVKLDVEGADLHALRGMAHLLAHFRPALLVERHDVYFYYTIDELTGLLTELGYQWREVMYATAPYLVCTPVET
jgi:FkbM family methyltransferase